MSDFVHIRQRVYLEPIWAELAAEELAAAQRGGPTWAAFVRKCEHLTGQPWNVIRQIFLQLHERAV